MSGRGRGGRGGRGGARGGRGRGAPMPKAASELLPATAPQTRGELELLASIKVLLAKGVDVNRRNKDGNTLLMVAANRGHAQIVAFLLSLLETDIDLRNPEGFCALTFASRSAHLPIVTALVSQGADIGVLAEDKESKKVGFLSSALPHKEGERTAVLAVATEAAYSYRTKLVQVMRADDNFLTSVVSRHIIAIIESYVMPRVVRLM